jgi:uncharacterized integral membrane protein
MFTSAVQSVLIIIYIVAPRDFCSLDLFFWWVSRPAEIFTLFKNRLKHKKSHALSS